MIETSSRFRVAAVAAAFASWALVAVGGVVRATESGLGCPDWPLCEGRAIPNSDKTPMIEFSHRATAAVAIALVVAVAIMSWRTYWSRKDILVPALVAFAFIPLQALLGAIVVWLEVPGWIVGAHFVVGMLFLAASVVTAVAAFRSEERVSTRGFEKLVRWTFAASFAAVVAGAVVVSMHADTACGEEWPSCNGALAAGGSDATAQVVHRMLAYAVAGLVLVLLVQAWRGRGPRGLTTALAAAVLGQLAIGVAYVLVGEGSPHGPLEALHVTGAGTVWGLVVALAALTVRFSRAERPAHAIVTPALE